MHTKQINGLPVYEDLVLDEECGMLRISLVDFPAVDKNFLALKKEKEITLLRVANEEQRLVRGVVIRVDYPIYRRDENKEYYTLFSKERVRDIVGKYLRENRHNRVNIQHNSEEVRGVEMHQIFIKDIEAGINPKGFEDIEDGSVFAEFKVYNDDVWERIKSGELRGFSLEGLFVMKQINLNKKNMLKKLLRKFVTSQNFAEVTTEQGVLTYEGELAVGTDVYLLDGEEVADAPDGEYVTETQIIVVAEGQVTEIREKENLEDGEDKKIADEVDIHNLADEVERLKTDRDNLLSRIEELEKRLNLSEDFLKKINSLNLSKKIEGADDKTKQSFKKSHEDFLKKLNSFCR